jgi:NAD(P)-dependent dehydrogenase (short-subunit alcohol dehydrogenase family)
MIRLEEKSSAGGVVQTTLERALASRLGQPEEIASVVRFLCSPSATLITGSDILVEGAIWHASVLTGAEHSRTNQGDMK